METKYKNINESLIKACLKGERRAQFELYRLYSQAMFNTSFRILNNTADAEDAVQEGFLKAFQNIGTYIGNVSFGAWLKRIIINTSLDFLRKKKIETEDIENLKVPVTDYETIDESEIEYKVVQIKKAINSLPDGFRIVLSLNLIEGYDHDEIAEILNIKASTSRSQLARAKKKLIELLKELENKENGFA